MTLELCIARYLLMAKRDGVQVRAIDVIDHIIGESYSQDDLLRAVDELEKNKFIESRHCIWSITQRGIDHFFRVQDGEWL